MFETLAGVVGLSNMAVFSPKSQTYLETLDFIGATKMPLKTSIGEHKHKPFGIFMFEIEMICYSAHFDLSQTIYAGNGVDI